MNRIKHGVFPRGILLEPKRLKLSRRHKKCLINAFKLIAFNTALAVVAVGLSALLYVVAEISNLKRDIPLLTGKQSILNLEPALSMLPRPDSLTSLIRFRVGWRPSYAPYVHDLLAFEQNYERHMETSRLVDCTSYISYQHHPKYSCKFSLNIGTIGCNIGLQYGYDETDPCILLKMNRVYGWMPSFDPELINASTTHGFPTIKIKCEGINDVDKDNIGAICYYDEEAILRDPNTLTEEQEGGCSLDFGQIRHYYFPYKKQRSYQMPFVWAKFLQVRRHVVIMIQCRAVAGNINEGGIDENVIGRISFEMLID